MVRKACLNDCEAIASIGKVSFKQAHLESCSEFYIDQFIQKHYHTDEIVNEILNTDHTYHVVIADHRIVGFSKLVLNTHFTSQKDCSIAKLDRIYLLPEYQNQSLGAELFDHILDFCREHEQKGIWLYVWVGNQRAIRFYEKNGFKIVGSYDYPIADDLTNPNHQMLLELFR